MIDELRLPALAAAALTVWMLCALSQQRRGRAFAAQPIWRQRVAGDWSEWSELPSPVLAGAVDDLARQCSSQGDTVWPDSTNVAYHRLLNAVLDRSERDPECAVQFAIVRSPQSTPDVLFVSPVHERTRGGALASK